VIPSGVAPKVFQGHVLDVLASLPEGSVQCVVTSPPYLGLRSYGTPPQAWGGDPGHAHEWRPSESNGSAVAAPSDEFVERNWRNTGLDGGVPAGQAGPRVGAPESAVCACGAWRGELGREPTAEMFVSHLGDVFEAVRRVLRSDGTLFLNIGDSYAGSPTGNFTGGGTILAGRDLSAFEESGSMDKRYPGVKPKDLIGVPWMLAFELRRRGWWLRAEIVWDKPNPMPSSAKDRPSRSHEQVFMFTKSATYFYDQDAERSPPPENGNDRSAKGSGYAVSTLREVREGYDGTATKPYAGTGAQDPSEVKKRIIGGAKARIEAGLPAGANLRTVWRIPTEPFPGLHFATFPQALPERCIKIGTSERGCCPACGTPWNRVKVEEAGFVDGVCRGCGAPENKHVVTAKSAMVGFGSDERTGTAIPCGAARTVGWEPGCSCGRPETVPCVVLDPFAGSGTTLLVARGLGRRSIGIELNAEYVAIARERSTANVRDLESFGNPP